MKIVKERAGIHGLVGDEAVQDEGIKIEDNKELQSQKIGSVIILEVEIPCQFISQIIKASNSKRFSRNCAYDRIKDRNGREG